MPFGTTDREKSAQCMVKLPIRLTAEVNEFHIPNNTRQVTIFCDFLLR
jgi:hypothetical protein